MLNSAVSDRTIIQQITNKLTSRGVSSPSHVEVQSRNGEVTLSGNLQHAHLRQAAVQVATAISGVRRVIDRMVVKPRVKQ
jgi:osmotically-inducible protein OsmY